MVRRVAGLGNEDPFADHQALVSKYRFTAYLQDLGLSFEIINDCLLGTSYTRRIARGYGPPHMVVSSTSTMGDVKELPR